MFYLLTLDKSELSHSEGNTLNHNKKNMKNYILQRKKIRLNNIEHTANINKK